MADITEDYCYFHDGRPAVENLSEDVRWHKRIPVCTECLDRFLARRIICKYCFIYVKSAEDTRPKSSLGLHADDCPRSPNYVGDIDGSS